ncbi:MAG: MoaD/ThiS family protein [Dehalococcoidia bacterium]
MVELQAYLAQYSPNSAEAMFEMDVPEGASVDSVIVALAIPAELSSVIVVNQQNGGPETVLKEGDQLTLIPPLAGG